MKITVLFAFSYFLLFRPLWFCVVHYPTAFPHTLNVSYMYHTLHSITVHPLHCVSPDIGCRPSLYSGRSA